MESTRLINFIQYFLTILCLVPTLSIRCNHYRNFEDIIIGPLKFRVSKDWELLPKNGIDSHVFELHNKTDTLTFSIGSNSGSVCDKDNPDDYIMARDTINGQIAYIVLPTAKNSNNYGLSIEKIFSSELKLSIIGKNLTDTSGVFQIFKSIRIVSSDTTNNPLLSMSKFSLKPTGSGKRLYNNNCRSCHHLNDNNLAPNLRNILKRRSQDWIVDFLSDSTLARSIHKSKCPKFYHLKTDEIQRLIDFIN